MNLLRILLFLTIALMTALLGCSSTPPLAGNSSSETTNGFVASIVYPGGAPAARAVVRVRSADYLADTNSAIAKVSAERTDTLTDDSGRFSIQSVDAGNYIIEAADANGNAVAIPCTVVDDSTVNLGTHTLEATGTITGTLGGSSVRGFGRIRGLERCVRADSTGTFTINVPAGLAYIVNLATSDTTADIAPTYEIEPLQTISVAGDMGTYRSDSLAVRAFLDGMGLDTVLVESVSLPDSVSGRVRRLDLSRRGLTTISPTIQKLSFLWTLDLGNNPLADIPATIGRMPLLTSLMLDTTGISTIPAELGNCINMQWLILNATAIRDLPSELAQLTRLHTLDISDDSLTMVPSVVFSLPSLTSLGLSRNQLTQLPASLGNLTLLEYLHLDGNRLDSLPQEIGALTHLKDLYAYSNVLTALPDSIVKCDSLRYIHLWNNALTSLPDAIVNLTPAEGLFLGANRLCSQPASIVTWANTYAEPNWESDQTCP